MQPRAIGEDEWGLTIDPEGFESSVQTLKAHAADVDERYLRGELGRLLQGVINHENQRVAECSGPSLRESLTRIIDANSPKRPPRRMKMRELISADTPVAIGAEHFSMPREVQEYRGSYEVARNFLKSKPGGALSDAQIDELCRCRLLKIAEAVETDRLRTAWSPEVAILKEHLLAELTLDHMAAAALNLELWPGSTTNRAFTADSFAALAEPIRIEFEAVRVRLLKGEEPAETIRQVAIKALGRLPKITHGGDRRRGGTFRRELLVGLVRLYEEVTGRPAVAGRVDENNQATGEFFHFARGVFLAVGRDLRGNGFKQVIDRIRREIKRANTPLQAVRKRG